MNRQKPPLDRVSMREEIAALRAETPDDQSIGHTVERVLAFRSPRPVAKPTLWRALPVVAAIGAVGLTTVILSPRAKAASLRSIADALHAQTKRHSATYRPDAGGKLVLRLEDWIDGERSVMSEPSPSGGPTVIGSDGRLMFRVETNGQGFVDDGDFGLPVESIDSYLRIPGSRLVNVKSSDGYDVYRVDGRTVVFDLVVDPATRLPMRRDVFTESGRLIERNVYDYPARFSDDRFRAPSGPSITDYPALRRGLAIRLESPGQTATLNGVTISLKSVLFNRNRLLALWTGGAKGEGQDSFEVEGLPKPMVVDRPRAFAAAIPSRDLSPDDVPTVGDERLRGESAWFNDLRLIGPFTLRVPVWTEDRTRPILGRNGGRLGFHSKLLGRVSFRIKDAIPVPDPLRVIWRPSNEPKTAKSGE